MRPDKYQVRKVEFVNGVYEISCVTNDWDNRNFVSMLDETLYFHLINLGWSVEDE